MINVPFEFLNLCPTGHQSINPVDNKIDKTQSLRDKINLFVSYIFETICATFKKINAFLFNEDFLSKLKPSLLVYQRDCETRNESTDNFEDDKPSLNDHLAHLFQEFRSYCKRSSLFERRLRITV